MDRQEIKELLREVLGPNVELVDHPKWVGLRCPLAPRLHYMGFSMRNIAALFSVGKTTIEKALGGRFKDAVIEDGKVFVLETRHPTPVGRVRRSR